LRRLHRNGLQEGVVCPFWNIPLSTEQKAIEEYEKFNKQLRIESDFDREVKKLLQKRDSKE